MQALPALSLAAVPGRRKATLELAVEIETRGYAGIYCPSLGDSLALCQALALVTSRIPIGTSITPLYVRGVVDFAQTASFIHETSAGRFRFGIGVSHERAMKQLGIETGKPLADTRRFVAQLREAPRAGELPPIILATLRQKMIALAEEIASGMVFANGCRSHMAASLGVLSEATRNSGDFFIGDMIPTCVSDDIEAAKNVNRRTLTGYALMPNYRNYWKEAGYVEEMEGIEKAIEAGDRDKIPYYLTDQWLADTTLFGPAQRIREELDAWYDAGVTTPILVPSSANGGQMKAFEEIFSVFERRHG